MFNVTGGQKKGVSDIVIKNRKIAGRFCKAQNRAMTHRGSVFLAMSVKFIINNNVLDNMQLLHLNDRLNVTK